MVDNNDALFREVNEELRREQFAKLWERYGYYIAGAAVALVVLIAGAKFWESQKLAQANTAGAEYEQATSSSPSRARSMTPEKAFDGLATTGPKGYAALSALAPCRHSSGNRTSAPKPSRLSTRSCPIRRPIRCSADFARIQAASLRLGEADFTEMENRLKPLIGEDSSWRYIANQVLGTSALRAGKLDEARVLLARRFSPNPG